MDPGIALDLAQQINLAQKNGVGHLLCHQCTKAEAEGRSANPQCRNLSPSRKNQLDPNWGPKQVVFVCCFVEQQLRDASARKCSLKIKNPVTGELCSPCQGCGKNERLCQARFKTCGRCHMARYCCQECQKEDWKRHKEECSRVLEQR